jgi:hypothetical protein
MLGAQRNTVSTKSVLFPDRHVNVVGTYFCDAATARFAGPNAYNVVECAHGWRLGKGRWCCFMWISGVDSKLLLRRIRAAVV